MQRKWDTARDFNRQTLLGSFLSIYLIYAIVQGSPTSGPQMGTSPWPVRNWDGGHTAGGEQEARE